MPAFLKHRTTTPENCYHLSFQGQTKKFPCSKHRRVNLEQLTDGELALLNRLTKTERSKIIGFESEWAVILCDHCSSLIELTTDSSACDHCGLEYNRAGQELAPRSEWGEETGETAADYIAGYNDPNSAFDE